MVKKVYGTFVSEPSSMPEGEHWAIMESTSVTTPGDERSRTHPGHGYPEHTKTYISYEAFTDKDAFETEVKRRTEANASRYGGGDFVCVHVAEVLRPGVKAVFEWQ